MSPLDLRGAVQLLTRHNAWRRSLHDTQQDPVQVGLALDCVLEFCRGQLKAPDTTDDSALTAPLRVDGQLDVGDPGQPSRASHETEHGFLGYREGGEDDGEG